MKQILLFIAIALQIFYPSVAQDIKPVDSIRIASLKAQLKTATGIAEVDLLNEIAWEYGWAGNDKTPAIEYASKAKAKALALNYQRGLGYAMITLSWNNMVSNPKTSDSMCNAAATIGEKLNDPALLGRSYHRKWDMRKAAEYYRKAGDLEGEAEASTWLCQEFRSDPTFKDEGFNYCQRAVELASLKWKRNISWGSWISQMAYENMGWLYQKVGDYQTALELLRKGQSLSNPANLDNSFAEVYTRMGKFDSAIYYQRRQLTERPNDPRVSGPMAEVYLAAGKYQEAIPLFKKSIKQFGEQYEVQASKWVIGTGYAYYHLNQLDSALIYGLRGYKLAQKGNAQKGTNSEELKNASKLLADIYQRMNSFGLAYQNLAEHMRLKDSLENNKNMWRLNMQLSNYKKAAEEQKRTSQLQLLQKDNLIKAQQLQQQIMLNQQTEVQRSLLQKNSEIKDQQLLLTTQELQIKDQGLSEQQLLRKQKESALALLDKESKLKDQQLKQQKFLRNALFAGLFLLLALAVFIIRYLNVKRKAENLHNEKVKAELQQQSSELEMQALRAQMNPHFIFNCLSSINRFILKNETETASDYLTRFSRLIRMVLINSQKPMIALEDEIDMLKLYLDMERLRFKDSFDYNITYTNTIESGSVFVPPLLLQPFCENAIWHGLMHKHGQGNLNINLSMKNSMLQCTITDNGIGRKKAEELKTKTGEKSKSLGLKITTDRLALLNQNRNAHTFFEMRDLYDEKGEASGTEVSIKVKYREVITELV